MKTKITDMKYCYNCGNSFSEDELTKEHIPPKCFSDVYPNEFKNNRITVLCCDECNNEYSKIDADLRDMIAIAKDGRNGNDKFLEKGVNSIIRRKVYGKDYVYDDTKGQYKISFNYKPIELLFDKCHKGMFYHKYGYPIDHDFVSQASQKLVNEKHNTANNKIFENFHKSKPDSFIISGHPEIFAASILAYKPSNGNTFEITEQLEECFALSTYMIFHNEIDCLVMSVKKDGIFYEMIKPSLNK